MFFCNGLPQFSEDLDFTLKKELDFRLIIAKIHKDMEMLGLKSRVSKIEETSVSFKFGAEGPLFTKDIERCFVRIEISKREEVKNTEVKEIKTPYYDLLPFTVVVMSPKEILAEKIRAILTRNYARDLYDLYFLLTHNTPVSVELIEQKLSYYQKKLSKKELLIKINDKGDIWKAELEPLVIGTLPDFRTVKKTLVEGLESIWR